MLQSSAYRTKRCPRHSSSRSSSSSTRLLSSGESGPPCGVPSTLGLTSPFSITPALRNARMSFNSRLSQYRARASFDPSHWLRGGDLQPMSEMSFETALGARVEDMLDACTRCGKCVEVCPSVAPAGIADAASGEIISGIIEIVRTGEGPKASQKWAAACMRSGECIKACDYGVNPRFLLAMARVAIAKGEHELPERRRQGLTQFRDQSRDVTMLSHLQLDGQVLERLGQKSASVAIPVEAPD